MREPTFLILTALARSSQHGYGLMSEVEKLSDGRVRLSVGTLYGALDRLDEDGLVAVEREEVVSGRLRRYYRLTDRGAGQLGEEVARMRRVAEVAERELRARKQNRPGPALA